MESLKAGLIIERPYPFTYFECHDYSAWTVGCRVEIEEGPAVHEGYCIEERQFSCDKEGIIKLEILSVAEMPGRYLDRIIYSKQYVDPEGGGDFKKAVLMATSRKFQSWIDNGPFPVDYENLDQDDV